MIYKAVLLLLLVLTAGFALLVWDAHKLLVRLDGVAMRAEAIETKANATLINLDKGTAVWAASAKDQAGAIQDLATDAHGTLSEANQSLASIRPVASALALDAESLNRTSDAATALVQALTADAQTVNDTIQSAQPLLQASTRTVDHFDALIQSPNLTDALAHVNGMADQGNQILTDFRQVADKERADWLKPVPWWKQPIKKSSDLLDIGAAISRHVP